MPQILFIEGVSGVGKSTMVRALRDKLQKSGKTVQSYEEFDFTNPIDFYATAYVPNQRYHDLLRRHPGQSARIARHSIPAGEAVLVRYRDENAPLFAEPLLRELAEMEFCYKPAQPVPLRKYTDAYQAVWRRFDAGIDGSTEYYLFDGALMHHPINDMMRNNHASPEQAAHHVQSLLQCLTRGSWQVFYLVSDDLESQLSRARQDRRQAPPDQSQIAFWKLRGEYDVYALKHAVQKHQMLNISQLGYDGAFQQIWNAARG